ncbi:MAG: hypothetical protein HFJ50_02645 [Clostridia bacterium]|jgi:hypothetical protein|nr:hypothetical protein [Clostridia bacterium]
MKRLKELGTWVILVIAFYLFSNGIIHIILQSGAFQGHNTNKMQVVNQVKK